MACGGNCAACMDGACVENREEIARINGIKEAEAVAAKAEAARKAAEAKKNRTGNKSKAFVFIISLGDNYTKKATAKKEKNIPVANTLITQMRLRF